MARKDKWVSFPIRHSEEVDRLIDEIIHSPLELPAELREWVPSVDLYETPEAFILEADLPGVRGEDIKVEIEGNDLVLQGRRLVQRVRSGGRFHYQERSFGEFQRRMALPESVDREKIEARFSDGVLRVILPKIKSRAARKE